MLMINKSFCTIKEVIKDHIVNFYNELFNGQISCLDTDLHLVNEVIPKLISKVDNKSLTCMPLPEDIYQASGIRNEFLRGTRP